MNQPSTSNSNSNVKCGGGIRVVYEMGRSSVAHHNESYMVLVTHSSSGVQLQVTVDVKVVSKVSPSLVLVETTIQNLPCVQSNTRAYHSCR